MNLLASVYGVNAVAFLANFAAILVYGSLAGPAGYGTYGIYIVFAAFYQVLDFSLVKTALTEFESTRGADGDDKAHARATGFLYRSVVPITAISIPLIFLGDAVYKFDPLTAVGGSIVLAICFVEHILSYPANLVTYRLTVEKRFRAVYALRLGATLLRQLFGWSVLWFTGSIVWAIAAIMLKGVVIGIICYIWQRREFSLNSMPPLKPLTSRFDLLASLSVASFVLIIMQELPTTYIDHVYGREALGRFRIVYDVVAAVWFVATIYPTMLFSYLLPRGGVVESEGAQERMRPLAGLLGTFHLAYFLGVVSLIAAERTFNGVIFVNMPFAIGVVGGVAILGYNRFLIEAVQAYGKSNLVVAATAITALLVFAILLVLSGDATLPEVGWAWVLSQIALMFMLKFALMRTIKPSNDFWFDVLLLPFPILAIVIADKFLPAEVVSLLSLALCLIAGGVLLMMVLRQPNLLTNVSSAHSADPTQMGPS